MNYLCKLILAIHVFSDNSPAYSLLKVTNRSVRYASSNGFHFQTHFINSVVMTTLYSLSISRMPVRDFHPHCTVYHIITLSSFNPGSKPVFSRNSTTVDSWYPPDCLHNLFLNLFFCTTVFCFTFLVFVCLAIRALN